MHTDKCVHVDMTSIGLSVVFLNVTRHFLEYYEAFVEVTRHFGSVY